MTNQIVVSGNLGEDPELRYTPSGAPVINLSLAVERRYMVKGEWEKETTWVKVQVWNDLAENVGECVGKGDRLTVVGRIQVRNWETDGGEKRQATEIVAEEVAVSLRWATVDGIKRRQKDDR